jgi:hypothetical protein
MARAKRARANISINHNTGKVGLHGSYSYARNRSYGELFAGGTENVPAIGGQAAFRYTGLGKPISNYHSAEIGADIRPRQKTTIGGSIYFSAGKDHNNNNNHGNYALKPDSVLLFNSYLDGINRTYNTIGSINLEQELSKGEKVNFDADYIYYKSDGQTNVESTFVDNYGNLAGAGSSLYAPRQRDLANTAIKVAVLKADYSKQINL